MPVISVDKDTEALEMTVVAEFDAPVERVWQLWDDPRQLERWWGPPSHPATVVDHDLTPGGWVRYFMTSPEGDKYHGWWRVESVDEPRVLEVEDGFADDSGEPNPDMPTTKMRVSLADKDGGGTRVTILSTFPSAEALQQQLDMGMEEGMREAMAQMDDVLAGPGR
jgi:uncharacterized protein YndB with AHSA1/START domain